MLTLSNKTYHFNLIAFFCFSFLLIFNGFSQDCKPTEYPFKAGEQIDYDVFYNMGKVWVPAGKVRFSFFWTWAIVKKYQMRCLGLRSEDCRRF